MITNIGKDHTDGAPGRERAVAKEKAGIIKPNSRVVLGDPMDDLRPIFEAEPSAGMWVAGRDFEVESNNLAVGGRTIDLRTPAKPTTSSSSRSTAHTRGRTWRAGWWP